MKVRVIVNIITFISMVVINGLANSLPLNGRMTGEISDSFPVLFTPAGYVFSIWGLIYLLLFGFTIYQALPGQWGNPRLERVGYWFAASSLFNIAWIFFWHYGLFPLTELAMLGVLVSLLMVYLRLDIGRGQVATIEKFLVDLPFSVYLGWISVATIANTSIFLYDLGWNGEPLSPVFWTMLVILVAMMLGIAMIWQRNEIAYPLVLIWAFAGIAVKQASTQAVAITAILSAVVLGLALIAKLVLPRRSETLRPAARSS